jgi:hypothetical protein
MRLVAGQIDMAINDPIAALPQVRAGATDIDDFKY